MKTTLTSFACPQPMKRNAKVERTTQADILLLLVNLQQINSSGTFHLRRASLSTGNRSLQDSIWQHPAQSELHETIRM